MKPEVIWVDAKGRPVLYVPLPSECRAGEVIRCDKHGLNFASADIARIRLRDVVKRDREAASCGRWVRLRPNFSRLHAWALSNAWGSWWAPPSPLPEIDRRPRYRWEVRR